MSSNAKPVRPALILAGLSAVALLVISQFAIPWLAENQVESRLTERGGEASVELSAFPALALLFNDGDRLSIEAREVVLEESGADRRETLRRLDGFDEVGISVSDSIAGPMAIDSFEMKRVAEEAPYELEMAGTTTGSDLAGFGAEQLGFDAPFLDEIAGSFGAGRTEIPVELDLEVISREGRLAVRDGAATIAGVPTGPVVEIVLAAIVARL